MQCKSTVGSKPPSLKAARTPPPLLLVQAPPLAAQGRRAAGAANCHLDWPPPYAARPPSRPIRMWRREIQPLRRRRRHRIRARRLPNVNDRGQLTARDQRRRVCRQR